MAVSLDVMEDAVSVTDVPVRAGEPSWQESLALAQEMAAVALAQGWPGALAAFRLTPLGAVELSGIGRTTADSDSAIPALAGFLERLLPPPGSLVEGRVPAGLRYTLIRARGGSAAPSFESLAEFSHSLARFEQGDRARLLAGLGKRLAPTQIVAAPTQLAPPAQMAPASREATSAPVSLGQASGPAGATQPSPWDDVTLATPVVAADAAMSVDVAQLYNAEAALPDDADAEIPGNRSRRKAGPVLTAVAVLSMFCAGIVIAAAIVVTFDSGQVPWWTTPPSTDKSSSSGQAPPAPATDPSAAQPSLGSSDTQSGSPVDQQARGGAVGTSAVDTDTPTTRDAPRDEAGSAAPDAGRPGEMVEALDVGNQPVFSPSFAADGSAIFFDENEATGGSTLKEARTGSGGRVVQVLSVVADGARNYHPRLSPDGSQVAFDSDRDGVRGVYVSDRAGQNIHRVSGTGYAAVPTWSPDGSGLAFVKAEPDKPRVWNVWLLTMATGEATRVTSYRVGQPWGASWLPDGRRICYSHEDRLVLLDLDTGESQSYTSPRRGALLRTPAVSPDGTRVIFQLHGDGAWMLDLRDGKMRKVLDDPTAEEFAWSPDGARVAFHSRRDRQWGIWVLTR